MPSWAWIALAAVALIGIGIALSACQRGYGHPAVVATMAVATAFETDGVSEAEQRRLNKRSADAVSRLRAVCDAMAASFPDRPALAAAAAEVEALALIVGHNVMEAQLKACVAFHAEAAGHYDVAYRLFFFAAIDSAYDRDWATEHGTTPKVLSDDMHYRVMAAILRLRAAGHATDIYHIGAEKVTGYTCARLKREAPHYADCR